MAEEPRRRRTRIRLPGVGPRRSLEDAVAGSVVVLTGASSGIGAATARRLGSAGATVVLVARRREQLEDVARAAEAGGGRAAVHPATSPIGMPSPVSSTTSSPSTAGSTSW